MTGTLGRWTQTNDNADYFKCSASSRISYLDK
jgi:hypothetical protein